MNLILIVFGKFMALFFHFFNVGSGSTWPGHIALSLNPNFIKDTLRNSKTKIVLIAGTNGKTTTGKLIQSILEKSGKKVFQNQAGANLLNGIASSLVRYSTVAGKVNYDYAIFEIDENTLPLILKEITPNYILLLNLFRDQLDRYGEVNIVANKWRDALKKLNSKTTLILNADDPQIASLRRHLEGELKRHVLFFGLDDKKLATKNYQHASDSTYCPNCGSKLLYSSTYYSHLGVWRCPKCKNIRPKLNIKEFSFYPLVGIYNCYNTNTAVLLARHIGVEELVIENALRDFKPAFGRQEDLEINGKRVKIFLSKNPTSFNESLRTIASLDAKNLLIILNDRIPDGRDVSWIWDVDFEDYISQFKSIVISGDRAYDMALRIKYATQNSNAQSQNYNSKFKTYEGLKEAISKSLKFTSENETLYVLPTYSAMLEVRKILTGKKIL